MKNHITALSLFLFINVFSQKVDTLLITPENVKGFVVREYQGMSTNDIYLALKKWTQYNIYNAEMAINSDIENEFISFTINGVGEIKYKNSDKWLWRLNLYVEARIKENKLRLDVIVKKIDGKKPSELKELPINPEGGINAANSLFKKDGSPRSTTKTYRDDVNISLNEFVNNIFDSMTGNKDYKKDDW